MNRIVITIDSKGAPDQTICKIHKMYLMEVIDILSNSGKPENEFLLDYGTARIHYKVKRGLKDDF